MRPLITILITGIYFIPLPGYSQPTWNSDIALIMFANCTSCHHEGGIAPYSLMTYSEAVEHGFDIKNNVVDGLMPPWPPDENYVHFKDEKVLSEDEINKIIDWASHGFPEGAGSPPPPPIYTGESQLDEIDATFILPTYTVVKETDEYRRFVIQTNFTETKYIEATEFLPDNGAIVHHMFLHRDTTDQSYLYDLADPLPGYDPDSTTETPNFQLLSGWVPGGTMGQFPPGMAMIINPGDDLVVELHYAPGSEGQSATPVLNFKFSDVVDPRIVRISQYLNYSEDCLQEAELFIPADSFATFHQIRNIGADDISVLSITPHMHYLGSSYLVYAVEPENDTVKLVNVTDWDFHWQGTYTYQKIVHLTSDAVIYGVGVYDNTSENEDNPSDPPVDVHAGGKTTDEMLVCYFTCTDYQEGDENIILDSTIIANGISENINRLEFNLFPDPVSSYLQIAGLENMHSKVFIRISDISGKTVYKRSTDPATVLSIDVNDLRPGLYFIEIESGEMRGESKFIRI